MNPTFMKGPLMNVHGRGNARYVRWERPRRDLRRVIRAHVTRRARLGRVEPFLQLVAPWPL